MASRRSPTWLFPVLGISLTALSGAAFPFVLSYFSRPTLEVQMEGPSWTPTGTLRWRAEFSEDLGSRLEASIGGERVDPAGGEKLAQPGLHAIQWTSTYAGGFQRRVSHVQLVGPMQSPAMPPCSMWLLVGQKLLENDDGDDLRALVHQLVDEGLRDFEQWPVGSYRDVESIRIRWAKPSELEGLRFLGEWSGFDAQKVPQMAGHLRVNMDIVFEKGRVPLTIVARPFLENGALRFDLSAAAKVRVNSFVMQWLTDLFDGSERATRSIENELQAAMLEVMDRPPPLPLAAGHDLRIEFCRDREILVYPDQFAAVPLAIAVEDTLPGPPLTVSIGAPERRDLDTAIVVELDENAINALLHRLWSSSILDRQLAETLIAAFNESELVQELLSLRLGQARFSLPPTARLYRDGLALRAAASLQIDDGEQTTAADLFAEILFDLRPAGRELVARLELADLDLTCRSPRNRLSACYAGLIDEVRAQAGPLQDAMTRAFVELIQHLIVDRPIGGADSPGHFVVERVTAKRAGEHLVVGLEGGVHSSK